MSEGKVKQLALKNITADPSAQMRVDGTSEAVVAEYAEAMKAGAEFPPVVVYHDPLGNNWLSEGFHRYAAAEAAGIKSILAEIRPGNLRDAVINATGSDRTHGLRRSNKDKRRAVETLLTTCPDWSLRQIADQVGVSHELVRKIRPNDQVSTVDTPDEGETEQVSVSNNDAENSHAQQSHTPTGYESSGCSDDAANAARTAAAKKLDDPEPTAAEPEVVVTHASAEKAIAVVEVVVRALKKSKAMLSGLMAGPYSQLIRNVSESVTNCKVYATGEMLSKGEWGSVKYGIDEHSTPAIDDMMTLCGGMKQALARADAVEVDGPKSAPWESADFDAVLRQDDDKVAI